MNFFSLERDKKKLKKRKREEREKMKDEAEIFSTYIKRVLGDPKFGLANLKHSDVYDTIIKSSSTKNDIRLGRISSHFFSGNFRASNRSSSKDRISIDSKKNDSVKLYIRTDGEEMKLNNQDECKNLTTLVERFQ